MSSIAELLFDTEKGHIHIPDFQRPWVWNKNQVRDLCIVERECIWQVSQGAKPVARRASEHIPAWLAR